KNHIKTDSEKTHFNGYANLKDLYQTGELNSIDEVRAKAKEQGLILSKGQFKAIQETRDNTPMAKKKQLEAKMKSFSPEQDMAVWKEMSKDEKDMMRNFITHKINHSHELNYSEKQAARDMLK